MIFFSESMLRYVIGEFMTYYHHEPYDSETTSSGHDFRSWRACFVNRGERSTLFLESGPWRTPPVRSTGCGGGRSDSSGFLDWRIAWFVIV